MVDLGVVGVRSASMVWVALHTFVGTMCVAMFGGVVLAGAAYYLVRAEPWWLAAVAVVLVLGEAAALGVVLGWKRALVLALAHGLAELRLGRMLVRLVFERIEHPAAGNEAASAEGRPVERPEALPLEQSEQRLDRAVAELSAAPQQGGWMRRAIRNPLLRAVRRCALARFREEGAAHDRIDMREVQHALEDTIDAVLVRKVRKGLRLGTVLAFGGFPLLVALQTWGLVVFRRIAG